MITWTPKICVTCGWPIARHRPYFRHVTPFRPVRVPPHQPIAHGRKKWMVQ